MKNNKLDFRDEVFFEVYQLMKRDKSIVVLTNDMGAAGLDKLYTKFRERVVNVGICEQNMMSVAGGLAQSGCSVFVYGIISHLIFRSLEQIKIDICLQNLPVHIIGVGAGLSYGQDGPTHHGIEDIGVTKVLPNLTIYNPSDPKLAAKLLNQAYKNKKPSFIRLDKEQTVALKASKNHDYFRMFNKNKRNIILSTGYSTLLAVKYQKIYKNFTIIDLFKLGNSKNEKITSYLKKAKKVLIFEENLSSSLFSDFIYKIKSDYNLKFEIRVCSLKKQFLFGSSSRDYIWKKKIILENLFKNL